MYLSFDHFRNSHISAIIIHLTAHPSTGKALTLNYVWWFKHPEAGIALVLPFHEKKAKMGPDLGNIGAKSVWISLNTVVGCHVPGANIATVEWRMGNIRQYIFLWRRRMIY